METSFTEASRDSGKSANNANRLLNNEGDTAAANISDTMEQLNQVGMVMLAFDCLANISRSGCLKIFCAIAYRTSASMVTRLRTD